MFCTTSREGFCLSHPCTWHQAELKPAVLKVWFPRPAGIRISGTSLEMQNLSPHPAPTEPETAGVGRGDHKLCFNQRALGNSDAGCRVRTPEVPIFLCIPFACGSC